MRKRIDWSKIDPLIKKHLSSLTIVEFTKQYTPETIPRTIGQRAKKLGVTPAMKTISDEHRAAVSQFVSKYTSTPETDDLLKTNNGKVSVQQMASKIGWSSYAVRKRLRELDLPIIRKISKDYVPPESNRIDWVEHDIVLKRELPNHTIAEFGNFFMPFASVKAIGRRAKKLGIKFKQYKPSKEHREMIADGVRQFEFTEEMDNFIKEHRDDMGQKEIANYFGIDGLVIWRRMGELGIKRDPEILREIQAESLQKAVKFSAEANRRRFASMSKKDKLAYRQRCSLIAQKAFKEGKIKPHHGIGQEMATKKGGKFRTRSSYETKYVAIIEEDPAVLHFEYEPFTIDYEFDGIIRCYHPDFLVHYADHSELIEIKPTAFIEKGRNPAKISAGTSYCLEEGLVFKVVTEEELFKN